MTFNHKQLLAALGMVLLAGAAHAQADTSSLNGWSVLGDVVSRSGALSLTTAYTDEAGNLSGNPAEFADTIEAAAGLNFHALDVSSDPAGEGTEGSLAMQSFAAVAGQTVSFDWSFSSEDTLFSDHAFVVIDGKVTTLATTSQPGSGVQTFSFTADHTGSLSLAFGVIDTGDYVGVSSLQVENLQSSVISPVPEPTNVALLLAGLGVVGFVAKRRKA
ncbi:MAG: hypothetical protein JWP52_80 [Rhizobacter sp.]|nr:hypothetical protein [Rhizobacter sp.]